MATYDLLTQRRGTALAEARQERCTGCQVRIRPQVFNEIRRGDAIIQCDSCQRILYFVHDPTPQSPAPPA
jgi:predicted  nucleic acid-binding Zn-ribbon protein